jgi:hypothetical protein
MPIVQGFPRGPYRLSTRFVAYRLLVCAVCALAAVGSVVGYGYMAWSGASDILHDQRIWNAGGPLLPASVHGKVTTRQFVLKSYHLEVEFSSPDGRERHHKVEFDTLFGALPKDGPMEVRVSPDNPNDFTLGAVVEIASKRWAAVGFFGVVGIFLIGGSFTIITWASTRQWRRVARAAHSGVPVSCPFVHREAVINQGRPTGAEKFTFRVPAAVAKGIDVEVTYQCRTKDNDIIQLSGEKYVLALVPPDAPTQAILLLRDYYPLRLSSSDRLQADSAIASNASWLP